MTFSNGSKLILFGGVLSQVILSGFAVASQPATAPRQAVARQVESNQTWRHDEVRLKREIQQLELELRAKQLQLELKRVHLEQLRLLNEPAEFRTLDLERSHLIDGHGWQVDAHGIIRDRSWRPVGNWGVDDAIGLWGVDDDGSIRSR